MQGERSTTELRALLLMCSFRKENFYYECVYLDSVSEKFGLYEANNEKLLTEK